MGRRDKARVLQDRIRQAYCKPGEPRPGVIVLTEVPAPRSDRRADMLALHLTKARPWIDGIEIKVDRSDWLAELDDQTKADAWFGFTHRWWIAVPEPGRVVDPAELPHGWGLICPDPRSSRRMKTLIKPDVRDPEMPYAAVVEVLKKLDNQRIEQVHQQVEHARREFQAEFDRRVQVRSVQEDSGTRRDLAAAREVADAVDLPLGQLQRRLADPGTRALVRAALQADTEHGHGQTLLHRQLCRAAQHHADTAAALHTALAALSHDS